MFKKLKDKIEEEFKPLRLPTSVQQLAQAISPSPSVNSLNDSINSSSTTLPDTNSTSSHFFSIGDDGDTLKTAPNFDLSATSSSNFTSARSRRSSINSIASDVSSLFPIHESPLNHNVFQSDLESEIDDGASVQLDKISKEKLYHGYKKLLYRYNKYKGRFVDLSKIHKDLLTEHLKTKNVLQETQDKHFKRIAELREQCTLEQKAKAHLEDALRSDLEEKDHVIDTLNTKITLLKENDGSSDDLLKSRILELEMEITKTKKLNESSTANVTTNVKEKIDELKSGIVQMKSENENLSNLLSKSPSVSDGGSDSGALIDFSDHSEEKIDKLNKLLSKCRTKINELKDNLRVKNFEVSELTNKILKLESDVQTGKEANKKFEEELNAIQEREKENVLAIAENKMTIHKELEAKEELIKSMTEELEAIRCLKEKLPNNTVETSDSQTASNVLEIVTDLDSKVQVFLQNYSEKVSHALSTVNNKMSKVQTDLNTAKTNIFNNDWKQRTEKLMIHVGELTSELEDIKRISKKKDEKIRKLTEETNSKIDRLVELGRDMDNLKEEKDNIFARMEQSVRLKEEWERKVKALEESNASMQIQYSKLNQQLIEGEIQKQKITQDSNEFRKKLEDNENKIKQIEELNQLLKKTENEKLSEIQDLSNELENLKQAKNDNSKSNEENETKLVTLQLNIQTLNEKLREKQNEIENLQEKFEKLEHDKLSQINELTAESETEINTLNQDMKMLNEKLQEKQFELEKQKEKVKTQDHDTLTKMNELNEELENLTHWKNNNLQFNENNETKINNLNLEIESLNKKLQEKQNEIENQKHDNLTKTNNLSIELENLKQLQKENVKNKEDNDTKINNLNLNITSLQQQLEEKQNEIENQKKQLVKQESAKVDDLTNQLENLKQLKENNLKCNEENKLSLHKLESEIKLLNEKLDEKEQEIENQKKIIQEVESEKLTQIHQLTNELERIKCLEQEQSKCNEDNESKLDILKSEIKFLNEKYENDLASFENNRQLEIEKYEKTYNEIITKLETVSHERDELKGMYDEKSLTLTELEETIKSLKNNLEDNCNGESKYKQLLIEHEKEIAKNIERIRDLEVENLDNKETLEHLKPIKMNYKKLKTELEEKDNLIESKIEELEELKRRIENERLNTKIDNDELLVQQNNNLKEKLEKQNNELEEKLADRLVQEKLKYEEIIQSLTKQRDELQKETKIELNECSTTTEDLESTSKIAVAAMESTSETMDLLRKEILQRNLEVTDIKRQHKREILEYQKVLTMRGRSPSQTDPETEHEYLRNILYEFMMGREQLVLAKVLAAIVKFDKQQTSNVLDRQTQLMNQIRIL